MPLKSCFADKTQKNKGKFNALVVEVVFSSKNHVAQSIVLSHQQILSEKGNQTDGLLPICLCFTQFQDKPLFFLIILLIGLLSPFLIPLPLGVNGASPKVSAEAKP